MRHRQWLLRHWLLIGVLAALLLLLLSADALVDRPLRNWLVTESNARLNGYTIEVDHLDFRPWTLSLRLENVRVTQDAHPQPPVAIFPAVRVDLQWLALLRGRVVADCFLDAPDLHLDLSQLQAEREDDIPLRDRGWQDLVELYRIRVNNLTVRNGDLTYVDSDPERPLRITAADGEALNIRHVTDRNDDYPSPVWLTARLFDEGRLELAGDADFLRRPHAAFRGHAEVTRLPLDALGPVAGHYQVHVSGGLLSARGDVEYSAELQHVRLSEVLIDEVSVDYVSPAGPRAQDAGRKIVETAAEVENAPATDLVLERLEIRGTLGWVNSTAEPEYRVSLEDAAISLDNLGNRAEHGEARFEASGLFMGSGRASARGVFRPRQETADFALELQVRDTQLPALNDVLRAHGKLDVVQGEFSLFSQIRVADGMIRGYVKPLFGDLEIYDPEQDADKNVFQQLYEVIAQGVARILENQPRDEVATITDLSGPLEDPDASTWQIIANLLRNAFIDAILPGFSRETEAGTSE